MWMRIGTLSERTGVSADVLRAWERRYGLLSPRRTEGNFRLYGDADLARVRLMTELLATGLTAGEAARQVLQSDGPPGEETSPGTGDIPLEAVKRELHRALRTFDEGAIGNAIDRVLATVDLDTGIRDVFLPALAGIGADWEAGALPVAQEHFSVGILRARLLGLARGWDMGVGPRALLACPPGEEHDTSLVMFGLALRRRGWRVTFLGANTPVEDLLATQRQIDAQFTVLFAVNWDHHRDLVPLLAAIPNHAIALAGAAASRIADEARCRWLEGDPVVAAEEVTREVAAVPATRTMHGMAKLGAAGTTHTTRRGGLQ